MLSLLTVTLAQSQGLILGEQVTDPIFAENAMNAMLKLLFVIGFGLYVVFSIVAVRQVQVMSRTLSTPYSGLMMGLALLHLLAALVLLGIAIVTL